jgi:hypothetical protein
MRRRRALVPRLVAIAALGIVGSSVLAVPAAPPVRAASDYLPDLRMAKLRDFRIVTTSTGRRLLRFTATMTNLGAGPLIVRSTRTSTTSPWRVRQIINRSDRTIRSFTTGATMEYGGDGHDHWHVTRMVDADLWSPTRHAHGAKIGFCFFDTTAINLSLPRAPSSPVYRESGCARRTGLSSTMGISVGWGDRYQWTLPFQWVDITGLPNGDYRLRAMVDARNWFAETSNTNNCTYSRLRISGSSVTLLGDGSVCTNDYSSSPYRDDIVWAMTTTAIIPACGVDLFCPADRVTRAQLARFLARAVSPPATTEDFFDDDDGSVDEAAINRLAAAGFVTGCGARLFCPAANVSRAATAQWLAATFALPAATADWFTDDAGLPEEDSINRAAEATVVTGCGAALFCPTGTVTRGELARFLHRAVGD